MFVRLFLCSLALTLTTTLSAQAAPVTMVRDYTYRASENDSKVSARKAALQQLQALVIEEVGVQVQSSLDSSERLDGEAFSRTVQTNIQSFAQALTRTRILEEQWDGEHFFLKAEIEVDPDGLGRQLQVLQKGTSADPCAAKAAEYQTLGKKLPGAQRTAELLALSLSVPFDYDCHRWQYDLAPLLFHEKVPLPGYRDYLFAQAKSVRPEEAELLLPMVIDLALREDDLSATEWQQIIDGLGRLRPLRVRRAFSELSGGTQPERENATATRHQSVEQLAEQIQQLLQQAAAGKIGTPPMSRSEVASDLYHVILFRQPRLAAQLLEQEYLTIGNPELALKEAVTAFLGAKPLSLEDVYWKALDRLLTRFDADRQLPSGQVSRLLLTLDLRHTETSEDKRVVDQVTRRHRDLFSHALNKRAASKDRDLLFIRYQLPDSPACQPADCARQLFGKHALEASELLLAYGPRANETRQEVLRKLERLLASNRFPQQYEMTVNLIRLLGLFPTIDDPTLALLVRAMGDYEGEPTREAHRILVSHYPASLDAVLQGINQPQTPRMQAHLVRVLADMPADPRIQTFLKALEPQDQTVRYFIEDALAAQLAQQP